MQSALPEESPEADLPTRSVRTNLLLSATIEAGGLVAPVRIRNLSERGALLEGAALPEVGARLILRRLQLEIGAHIVWKDKARCGVRFEGAISVAGWREGNWIAPAAQGRVDAIQATTRSGQLSSPPVPAPVSAPAEQSAPHGNDAEIEKRIAGELVLLQHLLSEMGARLIEAPGVVAGHPAPLQQFDLVAQTLGHLANVLRAEDRSAAIEEIGMEELRRRLQG